MPTICSAERSSMSPRVEQREERYYLSILTCVQANEIPSVLPGLWQEVAHHLAARAVPPPGPPFVRHVITRSDGRVEWEAAVPVFDPVRGNHRIRTGVLPAGRYAVVPYAGALSRLSDAHDALIDWGGKRDVTWDSWPLDEGIAWGGCLTTFSTYRQQEPHSPRIEAEIECRMRLPAAARPRSSCRLTVPSRPRQGSSQNDSAAACARPGSRR